MLKRFVFGCAVALATLFSNPLYSQTVEVKVDGTTVTVDLTTAEVLLQPTFGELQLTDAGVVYLPTANGTPDTFAFEAEHLITGAPVLFLGDVRADGSVLLGYRYETERKKDKGDNPNGTENPDGTITVSDGTTTVTGTVVQEPGTTIDFPDGTVIVGTDNSVSNDVGIIDSGEGSEVHVHDEVGSHDELEDILNSYPDHSIPAIVLVGHGAGNGGVLVGSGPGFTGPDLPSDLEDLIDQKLKPGAPIYVLGCDQFEQGSADGIQDLADGTGHPVISNEAPVIFVERPLWWDYFYGEGHWVQVDPVIDP